mmetsp:Transcript_7919/g.28131  ORF Transcript_7919/g.28131 Transcript_7919/m.28131 type:complete len:326 (+) Transcript_7919:1990-2967(+)
MHASGEVVKVVRWNARQVVVRRVRPHRSHVSVVRVYEPPHAIINPRRERVVATVHLPSEQVDAEDSKDRDDEEHERHHLQQWTAALDNGVHHDAHRRTALNHAQRAQRAPEAQHANGAATVNPGRRGDRAAIGREQHNGVQDVPAISQVRERAVTRAAKGNELCGGLDGEDHQKDQVAHEEDVVVLVLARLHRQEDAAHHDGQHDEALKPWVRDQLVAESARAADGAKDEQAAAAEGVAARRVLLDQVQQLRLGAGADGDGQVRDGALATQHLLLQLLQLAVFGRRHHHLPDSCRRHRGPELTNHAGSRCPAPVASRGSGGTRAA